MMTEENKKTIIFFIAGLLVGGLLVFIFSEPPADAVKQSADDSEATASVSDDQEGGEDSNLVKERQDAVKPSAPAEIAISGKGAITVADQSAGEVVALDSVEFPAKAGWIGVRDYQGGQLTGLLGVARFDTEEGLLPDSVRLLRATEAGKTYAVVFYSDNGDKTFSLATDGQFSGVMETFEAR